MKTHARRPAARTTQSAGPESGPDLRRVLDAGAAWRGLVLPAAPAPDGPVIGRADDRAEAEADRAADAVVGGCLPSVPGGSVGGLLRSAAAGPDHLGGTAVEPSVLGALARRRGSGRPLEQPVAESMSAGFGGHDFSGVRVHTDATAAGLAEQVHATAFTSGSDVYFSRGAYDPSSPQGQHLLAHELSHVVQGGGSLRRRMPTKAEFKLSTDEGPLAGRQTAQVQIGRLLEAYERNFAAVGAVPRSKYPKALVVLREIDEMADLWLDDNTVEDEQGAMLSDPDRTKRLYAFQLLSREVRAEIEHMKTSSGEKTLPEVTEPRSKEYLKVDKRYRGDLKGKLQQLGAKLDEQVPNDGDAANLDAEFQVPVDPTGIGYLGGKISGEVTRDQGKTNLKMSLALTGGASLDGGVQVGAELGGWFTAEATSGARAMELVSYALYRRAMESHTMPRELGSFLWGGDAGEYGRLRAKRWAKRIERDQFGDVCPTPEQFALDNPQWLGEEHRETRDAAFAARCQEILDNNAAHAGSFVETGGSAGVGVAAEGKAFDFGAGASASLGRRYDAKSMENRKQGSGRDGARSSSGLATLAGKIAPDRGAETSSARNVQSFSVGAACTVAFPGFSANGSIGYQKRETMQGLHGGDAVDVIEESVTLSAKLSMLSKVDGAQLGDDFSRWIVSQVDTFLAIKAAPEADKRALLLRQYADRALGGTANSVKKGMKRRAGKAVGAVTHLPGNSMRRLGGAAAALQAKSGKEILADAAYSAYGTDTKHLSLTYNFVENTATLEIRSQRGVAVRVEGKVKGSVTKSSRDFKASYSLATNTWTPA